MSDNRHSVLLWEQSVSVIIKWVLAFLLSEQNSLCLTLEATTGVIKLKLQAVNLMPGDGIAVFFLHAVTLCRSLEYDIFMFCDSILLMLVHVNREKNIRSKQLEYYYCSLSFISAVA